MSRKQNNPRVTCCLVGLKGSVYLKRALELCIPVSKVITYNQSDDISASFSDIRQTAISAGVEVEITKKPQFTADELIFVVGWQYLFPTVTPSTVVFHDSLLPRYRGFAPTVTALVRGEGQIGVTALLPVDEVDAGPIVSQAAFEVTYPCTIKEALTRQASTMADMSKEIAQSWLSGHITAKEQDHSAATYSIWRDDHDFFIDWSWSADQVARFVAATGYPYDGAKTVLNGEAIRIRSASVVDDIVFEVRQPGKIWRIENNKPMVVCGSGMIWLNDFSRLDGSALVIGSLRSRFTW